MSVRSAPSYDNQHLGLCLFSAGQHPARVCSTCLACSASQCQPHWVGFVCSSPTLAPTFLSSGCVCGGVGFFAALTGEKIEEGRSDKMSELSTALIAACVCIHTLCACVCVRVWPRVSPCRRHCPVASAIWLRLLWLLTVGLLAEVWLFV